MKNVRFSLLGFILFSLLFASATAFAQNYNYGNLYVQTNSVTNLYNYQATLNGYLNNNYNPNCPTYVGFQWGPDTSYDFETLPQQMNYSGSFSQAVNLNNYYSNTFYHFRAAAKDCNGNTVYGQDMTFTVNGSGNYINGNLSISKKVINLTSGNLNWQPSVNAKPNDILSFAITLQANGVTVHNINVRDYLPANLIYNDNLTINTGLNYSNDPRSGIYVGTLYAGQVYVVSYQARVASVQYGTTTLSNNVTVTSQEAGTQTASASIIVNSSAVSGATYIPTGITNNPITDSFLVPLFLLMLSTWLYFSGRVHRFASWLKTRL